MYNSSYYDNQIADLKKDERLYNYAINKSFDLIAFENDRDKKRVAKLIEKFFASKNDIQKMRNVRLAIVKIFEDYKKQRVSYFDLSKILNNDSFYTNLEYDVQSDLSDKLQKSPVEALMNYLSRYMETLRSLETTMAAKQKAAGEKLEEEKESRTEEKTEQAVMPSIFESSFTYSTQTTKPDPFAAVSKEESKKAVEAKIEEMLSKEGVIRGFTSEEESSIKKLYPDLGYSYSYTGIDTLTKGMEIERVFRKSKVDVEEMIAVVNRTYDVTVADLLSDSNNKTPDLFWKIGVSKSFDKYRKIYSKYMKQYNSLSKSDKARVDGVVSSNNTMSKYYNGVIPNPDALKSRINQAVKEKLINEPNRCYSNSDELNSENVSRATKYMAVSEIVGLYRTILSNMRMYGYGNESVYSALQDAFSQAILNKLESFVNTTALSEEEKKEYFEQRRIKRASIIRHIFKEEPYDSYLKGITELRSEEEVDNMIKSYDTKEKTNSRVYGLSRVEKTLAKFNGKWNKYLKLIEKETLSEEETESLNKMFR